VTGTIARQFSSIKAANGTTRRRPLKARENWQAMWTCAVYLLFAITLWLARAAQIPK
jgi:hypothetical protein